jgi:hypothetical protein
MFVNERTMDEWLNGHNCSFLSVCEFLGRVSSAEALELAVQLEQVVKESRKSEHWTLWNVVDYLTI